MAIIPSLPVVAVGVVVIRDNRVLLIRRRNPPLAGTWSLPGGRQEFGESFVETARREVREETGLIIEPQGIIGVVDLTGADYHITVIEIAAKFLSGDLIAGDDALEAVWQSVDDLGPLDLTPKTRQVIAAARQETIISFL